jgi:hypothetical protein
MLKYFFIYKNAQVNLKIFDHMQEKRIFFNFFFLIFFQALLGKILFFVIKLSKTGLWGVC